MESKKIAAQKQPKLGFLIHAYILKFLDVKTVFTKMIPLSRAYREFLRDQNYTMIKKM